MNNNENKNQENQNENINGNENENESKPVEAEVKSAAPILAFGITFVLLSAILRMQLNPTKIVLLLALSFVVYQIVKSKFPAKKVEIVMEEKPEPVIEKPDKKEAGKKIKNPELKNINERIDLYFIEMKLLNDSIDNAFISGEILEMEETLKKIQAQVNDESKPNLDKRIEQLNDFFDYYMPTTIKILNSYRKIESQNLTGENATETKKRVEESLPFIKKAFAKELDNMFSDEMIDITTDIDVLESMLSKDGLINKHDIKDF